MKFVVLGCLLVTLCGCVPKPFVISDSAKYAAPGSAFEGKATVYVMRGLSGVGIKPPVHVALDGVKKGSLRRASFMRLAVAPGHHVITAHWNHLIKPIPDIAVSSNFAVGKTYYFMIGTSTGVSAPTLYFGSNMGLVNPSVGAELVHTYNDRTPGVAR